jgi:hypothetical protein
MSKMAAIDIAVRLQLASDGKGQADYTRLMSGPATSYQYDPSTMQSFLFAVSNRLKLDTPHFLCSWDTLAIGNCLTASLAVLIGYIERVTITEE